MVLRGASDSGPPRPRGPRARSLCDAGVYSRHERPSGMGSRPRRFGAHAGRVARSRVFTCLSVACPAEGVGRSRFAGLGCERGTTPSRIRQRSRRPSASWGHALVSLVHRGIPGGVSDADRSLIHLDPMSFAGWYGLGECNQKDRVVVPDPRSRSGWRFRSSVHEAVVAYARAFQLIPATPPVLREERIQAPSRSLVHQRKPMDGRDLARDPAACVLGGPGDHGRFYHARSTAQRRGYCAGHSAAAQYRAA